MNQNNDRDRDEYYVAFVLNEYVREDGKCLHITIAFPGKIDDEEELITKVDKFSDNIDKVKFLVGEEDDFGVPVVKLEFADKNQERVIREFHSNNTKRSHISMQQDWIPHISYKETQLRDRLFNAGQVVTDTIVVGVVGSERIICKVIFEDEYSSQTDNTLMCGAIP